MNLESLIEDGSIRWCELFVPRETATSHVDRTFLLEVSFRIY